MFARESAWLLISTLYHFFHFAYVKKRNIWICLCECSPFISSNPFFTNPVRWSTHLVAKMKLSVDFLAASSPASSVCFPFGRQAKLLHSPSTFVVWMGWSLSIDQIYSKERQVHQHISVNSNDNLAYYRHPSGGWTRGQTFRPFVPCHS
jgi:hypothetical protein